MYPLSAFHVFGSLNRSEALRNAASLACHQLQTTIRRGGGPFSGCEDMLQALSALVHLDPFRAVKDRLGNPGGPFQALQNGEMGLALIADILRSAFPEVPRYMMASQVFQLLAFICFPTDTSGLEFSIECASIPPLLDFLSLSEEIYDHVSPPHAGSIALRILSTVEPSTDLVTAILPILSSTLHPTHPLQSRVLALKIFKKSLPLLFSSQTENVTAGRLKDLLRAVGDPFVFTPDTSPPNFSAGLAEPLYFPNDAAAVLIELALSDSWREHLHSSNFTTCEEFLSTEEGRGTVIDRMPAREGGHWPEPLCTPTKIVAAITHLEDLQCLNTAETVIMWAWTVGVLDIEDRDSWGLIERTTLSFYHTHGARRRKSLEQHITSKYGCYSSLLRRNPERPARLARGQKRCEFHVKFALEYIEYGWEATPYITQVCQLRRLYCLFGHNPTTREGAVADEAGKRMDSLSAVTPASFSHWACDYP